MSLGYDFMDRDGNKWFYYDGSEDDYNNREPDYYDDDDEIEQKNNKQKIATEKERKEKLKDIEHKKILYKLVASCKTHNQIRDKLIKLLIFREIDKIVGIYFAHEFLPMEYKDIVFQDNCLEVLIKDFLKKNLNLNNNLISEINILIESISKITDNQIVYNRVKKIQKFIHNKIDQTYGQDFHLNLSARKMRKLLSLSRLHLNLKDLKYKDINLLFEIFKESNNLYLLNKETSNIILRYDGKMAKKTNSAMDYASLIEFADSSLAKKINKLYELEQDETFIEYRKKMLAIYEN